MPIGEQEMRPLAKRDAVRAALAVNGRNWISQAAAFWMVAYGLAVLLIGGNLLTPLYVVYQDRWHFSAGVLTVIFAAYIGGVLVALLGGGRLSDAVGRKRLLLPAVVLSVLAALIFLAARDVGWLIAGRVLQGLATGTFTATASAALADLEPRGDHRRAALVGSTISVVGLAIGPLVGGLLAQYAPLPTTLVFLVLLALLAPALIGIALMPEPLTVRPAHASLRPQRLSIPAEIRRPFAWAMLAVGCGWIGSGLFLGLGPSLVASLLHMHNRALGGGVVFLLFGTATATQILLRRTPIRTAMGSGLPILVAGLALIVLAMATQSLPLFLTGTIGLGLGQGLAFMGGMALINRVAPAARRGEVFATLYAIAYLGTGILVPAVGFAAGRWGLFHAVIGFALLIGATALLTTVGIARLDPASTTRLAMQPVRQPASSVNGECVSRGCGVAIGGRAAEASRGN